MKLPPLGTTLARGMSAVTSSSFLSLALGEPACASGGNLEGDVRPLMAAAASTSVFWEFQVTRHILNTFFASRGDIPAFLKNIQNMSFNLN